MSKITKKMLIIIGAVLLLGVVTIIPGFAETEEELSKIFVTRDEWKKWVNGYNTTDAEGSTIEVTGLSEYLNTLEAKLMEEVANKTESEMKKRGMETTTTVASTDAG